MKKINVKKLYDDFADLGWDYTCNRMSRSAMECYDAIAVNLGVLEPVSYTHLTLPTSDLV